MFQEFIDFYEGGTKIFFLKREKDKLKPKLSQFHWMWNKDKSRQLKTFIQHYLCLNCLNETKITWRLLNKHLPPFSLISVSLSSLSVFQEFLWQIEFSQNWGVENDSNSKQQAVETSTIPSHLSFPPPPYCAPTVTITLSHTHTPSFLILVVILSPSKCSFLNPLFPA